MVRRKKWLALLVCFALVFTMSLSFFYIAEKLDHDCAGENCPICAAIEVCQQTLAICHSVTGPSAGMKPDVSFQLPYLLLALPLISFLSVSSTLVTLRVKLSD